MIVDLVLLIVEIACLVTVVAIYTEGVSYPVARPWIRAGTGLAVLSLGCGLVRAIGDGAPLWALVILLPADAATGMVIFEVVSRRKK